mmetsp:Transcript_21250/g.30066  ORF Transcript_21250/g.30066 Transcript_21250/m.30066 type:complete len:900 (+) Transcript_21250:127-2826(+)
MNLNHNAHKKIGPLDYSLDVLTDGSEHTGHGTIFLTISRRCVAFHIPLLEEEENRDNIMARYAISGLSSMTARLCADQKLSLSKVRAVTCPNHSSCIGLSSLLLALSSAGQQKLAVIGGTGIASYAETVASIILRNRAYPRVATCEVPQKENREWWKIYEDEYIIVHGSAVVNNGSEIENGNVPDNSEVVLLYTLRHEAKESLRFSFCVLPPGHSNSSSILRPLPLELDKPDNSSPLNFILCLGLSGPVCLSSISDTILATCPSNNKWDTGILIRASSQVQSLHRTLPFAFPVASIVDKRCSDNRNENEDGIDVFHNNLTIKLNSCTSIMLPGHSFWPRQTEKSTKGKTKDSKILFRSVSRKKHIWNKCVESVTQSSPTIELNNVVLTEDWNQLRDLYCVRKESSTSTKSIYDICYDDNEIDLDEDDAEMNDHTKVHFTENDDCNEICLSGGEQKEQEQDVDNSFCAQPFLTSASGKGKGDSYFDPSKPHLLVLGTGCASPSPSRGASGYALLLPTFNKQNDTLIQQDFALTAVIECGEGTLTNLFRHLPGPSMLDSLSKQHDRLQQIRFIWISHAHLDHYGGLPCLIRAVWNAGGRVPFCNCGEQETKNKKRKLNIWNGRACCCKLPPVIIAPSTVLQFLDASLNCKNGKIPLRENPNISTAGGRDNYDRLFHGVTHSEFEGSPFASEVRDIVFNTKLVRRDGMLNPTEFRPLRLLRSIPVEHCPDAHGLVLGLNFHTEVVDNPLGGRDFPPFLLCFSGDTRPSPRFVRACDEIRSQFGPPSRISFLMHESTFDDETRGKNEAIKKRHSTVREALDIACQVQADATLLTHFSQRYPRVPPGRALNEKKYESSIALQQKQKRNFCFASDGLLIPLSRRLLSSLWLLSSSLLNALQHNQS